MPIDVREIIEKLLHLQFIFNSFSASLHSYCVSKSHAKCNCGKNTVGWVCDVAPTSLFLQMSWFLFQFAIAVIWPFLYPPSPVHSPESGCHDAGESKTELPNLCCSPDLPMPHRVASYHVARAYPRLWLRIRNMEGRNIRFIFNELSIIDWGAEKSNRIKRWTLCSVIFVSLSPHAIAAVRRHWRLRARSIGFIDIAS